MRVRMKTRYANGKRAIEPDHPADLPDDEALDLIEKGFAAPEDSDPSHPATGTAAKMRAATPDGDPAVGKPAKRAPAKKSAPKKAAPAKQAANGDDAGDGDAGDGDGGSQDAGD